jgi:hypothetical protein
MTANEINNNYFTVERSDEGSKFLPLKNMNGAGNSTAMLHYKYTDEKPLAGANCYRIKQTDYDGHFTYSPIKKVRLDKILSNQEITMESIGPNPFTESFLLNYSTISDGKVNLTLINSTGGIVKQETLNVVKGNNSYQFIDNTNIAPGIYYLTLAMNDKVVTKKIIKN